MDPSHFCIGCNRAKLVNGIIHRNEIAGFDMEVTTVGIDLAKNEFQLHGVDERVLDHQTWEFTQRMMVPRSIAPACRVTS